MKDISHFNEKYFGSEGISWPDSESERAALARTIFGMGFVEAHDSWIKRARDIARADGPEFPPAFGEEQRIRSALAALSQDQMDAVMALVRLSVHGALFSALVSMDQFPRADLHISVRDEGLAVDNIPIAPSDVDLHDDFFEWLAEYSSADSAP